MTAIRRPRFALIVLLFASAFARADLTAKPNAYTENDHYRESVEFNRQTLVEAYKTIGNKNPAWDADAIEFLDTASVHFAAVLCNAVDQPKAPDFKALTNAGEAVVKKGCDDPMVLYCYGVCLTETGHPDEGKPVLKQAYKGLITSKYSPDRIYYAARRMLGVAENIKERMDITAEMEKLRPQLLTIKFVNPAHRRLVAQSLYEEIGENPTKKQLDFYEQMVKDKSTDKWIVNLFGGRYFVKAAWAARGNGWANQVKPDGWRGFEGNLERARECLTIAWKLAPNLPEAPTEMITVAMGSSRQGESIRTWFDRAIDAQFDYREAYNSLRWARFPRWGGSHEEMLALGIEAYRTGRYDTWVPYELIRSLESIREDRGGDMSLWDKPETYEMVRDLMLAYAAKFKDRSPESYRWYITYAAAIANRQNKHAESRKFLEQINDQIDEALYRHLQLNPKLSVSESYLLTGPFGDRYSKALELQKAEKHEQAAPDLQKILDEMPKDDKGQVIVREYLQRSQDVLKFATGEWLDLSPRVDNSPWIEYGGAWSTPKQGDLMGIADDPRGLMALGGIAGTLGNRYEFAAEIEIKRMPEIQSPNAGLIFNFTGFQTAFPGVWVYPTDKKIFTRGSEDKWLDVPCPDKFKILVRVIDDEATVMIDDKQVAKITGVARANAKHTGIGLAGMYQLPQGTAVFREMRVRKMKKEGE